MHDVTTMLGSGSASKLNVLPLAAWKHFFGCCVISENLTYTKSCWIQKLRSNGSEKWMGIDDLYEYQGVRQPPTCAQSSGRDCQACGTHRIFPRPICTLPAAPAATWQPTGPLMKNMENSWKKSSLHSKCWNQNKCTSFFCKQLGSYFLSCPQLYEAQTSTLFCKVEPALAISAWVHGRYPSCILWTFWALSAGMTDWIGAMGAFGAIGAIIFLKLSLPKEIWYNKALRRRLERGSIAKLTANECLE